MLQGRVGPFSRIGPCMQRMRSAAYHIPNAAVLLRGGSATPHIGVNGTVLVNCRGLQPALRAVPVAYTTMVLAEYCSKPQRQRSRSPRTSSWTSARCPQPGRPIEQVQRLAGEQLLAVVWARTAGPALGAHLGRLATYSNGIMAAGQSHRSIYVPPPLVHLTPRRQARNLSARPSQT